MNQNTRPALRNLLLSTMFVLAITIPLIFFFFSTENKTSKVENRTLALAPTFPTTKAELQEFPGKFDSFFADHFGFRDAIIRAYNISKLKIGDSPTDDIMIGKDGWLYLGSPRPNNKYKDIFDSAINAYVFEPIELERIASHFEQKRQWLEDQEIAYIFVLVPEKHTIYPEYLPAYARRPQGPIAIEQLREHLTKHTNVTIVDVAPEILMRKKQTQVYFKTDTHWNHEGSYVAYKKIIRAINDHFSESDYMPINLKIDLREDEKRRGDISNFVGVDVFDNFNPKPFFSNSCTPEEVVAPQGLNPSTVMTCDAQQLKLLLFGDSFSAALITYFSHSFAKTTFVQHRPSYEELKRYIDTEKPDVVIEQWVERKALNIDIDKEFVDVDTSKLFNESAMPIFEILPKDHNPNQNLVKQLTAGNEITYDVLKASGYIHLTGLEFEPRQAYVLEIDATYNTQSSVQLFFTDSKEAKGSKYSNDRSLQQKVSPGNVKLYFHLNFENLGPKIRIHPSLTPGEITIRSIKIKAVEGDIKTVTEASPTSP